MLIFNHSFLKLTIRSFILEFMNLILYLNYRQGGENMHIYFFGYSWNLWDFILRRH